MFISRARLALLVCVGAGLAASPFGCSAGNTDAEGGADPTTTSGTNVGGNGGSNGNVGGGTTTGMGGGFVTSGGGDGGSGGAPPINPCGTECGPTELCDGIHKGIDDNCNGVTDEGCECGPGESDSCFKGDPSFLNNPLYPTCQPGTMSCTENGTWGPCIGGNHADIVDNCSADATEACHPINAVPFQTVDLLTGTGTFSSDAVMSSFVVECPVGVNPCPMVSGNNFQALQSGEYTVTYTKTKNDNTMESCEFPLYVGAKGLRVELTWNWGGSGGKDIDFHMHRPMATTPWNVQGNTEDCGYNNCAAGAFVGTFPSAVQPNWFDPANMVPDPVNWYEASVFEENLCYFAPKGNGNLWANAMQGCHSPRLDADNISCDLSVTDPSSSSYCFPENINIDYPPRNEWIRISAFMFSSSPANGLTPNVKIYCDGALRAELGQFGFHNPESPIVWDASQGRKWWMIADVAFKEDECSSECVVRPLYQNDNQNDREPLYYTESQATSQFGMPYAPLP